MTTLRVFGAAAWGIVRPHLLEPNGFCFWNARFETYVKSKDIDLRQVIQKGDFYYEVEDSKTKLSKETPYELLEDDQKKKLGKNNEAKMTLYNALPRKDKNHMRKFLHDLPFKWKAMATSIEEAKDLVTLSLDELVENLKVYEMILENDGVVSKSTTKEKDAEVDLVMAEIGSIKDAVIASRTKVVKAQRKREHAIIAE
nr:zf-CCHC domain-containing protein/DUF4219 domain-containing protein/UBN2 domain-containing protein [Tanacetum cinerariifolium]